MSDIVISTEQLATAGAVTYWRMSGDLDLKKLREIWTLPANLLPEPPSEETALRRAVNELQDKRRLVRPLARRGRWAVVDEKCTSDALDYNTDLIVSFTQRTVVIEPADHRDASRIRAAFVEHQGKLLPIDVSAWLVRLCMQAQAVSLRDTGGIYFVPRTMCAFWETVTAAVQAVSSCKVFRLPAMRTTEAIDAVVDAITSEATSTVEALFIELADHGDASKRLGKRALQSRIERIDQLAEKIGTYETLLGQKLESVRERVNELNAGISAVMLAVEAETANG